MKPYIQLEKHKGKVEVENDERLPHRLRKLAARKKREARREKRKSDKASLKEEWGF